MGCERGRSGRAAIREIDASTVATLGLHSRRPSQAAKTGSGMPLAITTPTASSSVLGGIAQRIQPPAAYTTTGTRQTTHPRKVILSNRQRVVDVTNRASDCGTSLVLRMFGTTWRQGPADTRIGSRGDKKDFFQANAWLCLHRRARWIGRPGHKPISARSVSKRLLAEFVLVCRFWRSRGQDRLRNDLVPCGRGYCLFLMALGKEELAQGFGYRYQSAEVVLRFEKTTTTSGTMTPRSEGTSRAIR